MRVAQDVGLIAFLSGGEKDLRSVQAVGRKGVSIVLQAARLRSGEDVTDWIAAGVGVTHAWMT